VWFLLAQPGSPLIFSLLSAPWARPISCLPTVFYWSNAVLPSRYRIPSSGFHAASCVLSFASEHPFLPLARTPAITSYFLSGPVFAIQVLYWGGRVDLFEGRRFNSGARTSDDTADLPTRVNCEWLSARLVELIRTTFIFSTAFLRSRESSKHRPAQPI
jgi:hypothetical protein